MTQHLLERHYGGWRPSLPDPRDQVADTAGLPIVDEVDPREEIVEKIGRAYNQFQLGSCTANADARAIDIDRIVRGLPPLHPSRLGIYFGERMRERQPADQDTGAMGRDGLWVARHVGLWPEADWPYVEDTDDPTSDPHFYTDPASKLGPAKVKLDDPYKSVPRSVSAFKRVLSNRQSVAIGFSVFESFESEQVAKTGVMPVPNVHREKMLGGHETLVVGYLKKHPEYALVANSWDFTWGLEAGQPIGGYFLMPWAVILDRSLSSDFRTIYRPAA